MDSGAPSLQEFLEKQWLPAIAPTVRSTTLLNYRLHVVRHISPRLGSRRLNEVTGSIFNEFYASLLRKGRLDKSGGLGAATVRRIHATLHRALRDAVRWGYLTENPVDSADPPRDGARVSDEMRTWEPHELFTFLRFVSSDPLYPLWLLLATTGMRRGEALGLRWTDVDFDHAQLAVRQTLVPVNGHIEISTPKTAKGRRVIALDEKTLCALRTRRAAKAGPASPNALVFCTEEGEPLNPIAISKRFARLVKESGLPKIRLHDLRHTHATLALRAGIHPKIVSERLGHATISLTLDVYSHAIPHMQREAAEQVAKMIFGSVDTIESRH